MKLTKVISLNLLIVLSLFSCQKDDIGKELNNDAPTIIEAENSLIPEEDLLKIKALGFDISQPITKEEEGYVVEGDILLPLASLEQEIEGPLEEGESIEKQFRHVEILRCFRARDVKVKINVGGIDRHVRDAMDDWNRVNGSFLRFRVVNGGNADININFSFGELGRATFPFNGRAGAVITIDPDEWRRRVSGAQVNSTLRYVISHELGHCIGFRHPNRNEGGRSQVPGTPFTDSQSLMNQGSSIADIVNVRFRRLSGNDEVALRRVYGGNPSICF